MTMSRKRARRVQEAIDNAIALDNDPVHEAIEQSIIANGTVLATETITDTVVSTNPEPESEPVEPAPTEFEVTADELARNKNFLLGEPLLDTQSLMIAARTADRGAPKNLQQPIKQQAPEFFLRYNQLYVRFNLDSGHQAGLNIIERVCDRADKQYWPEQYEAFRRANPEFIDEKFVDLEDEVQRAQQRELDEYTARVEAFLAEKKAKAARQKELDAKLPEASRTNAVPMVNGIIAPQAFDPQAAMIAARAKERAEIAQANQRILLGSNPLEVSNRNPLMARK